MFLGALMKGSTMAESKRTLYEGTRVGVVKGLSFVSVGLSVVGAGWAFSVLCSVSLVVWVPDCCVEFASWFLVVELSLAWGFVVTGFSSFGVFRESVGE